MFHLSNYLLQKLLVTFRIKGWHLLFPQVFFYYAYYKSGAAKDKSKVNWLSRKELDQILPDRYKKSVTEFLIDETYWLAVVHYLNT